MPINPKVFRNAIRRLPCCTVCCYAIDERYLERRGRGERPLSELVYFADLMGESLSGFYPWWPRSIPSDSLSYTPRIIALQLAACVAQDENARERRAQRRVKP